MPKKFKFEYPRGNFPRLCLIGNSNVGKSSLTKLLLSHPKWYKGKVGKTAGSTYRLTIINDPNLPYHVIDLPGFGHMSRVGKDKEGDVKDQILKYIELDASNIFLMLMVISADRLDDELQKWYFDNPETIPLSVEFIQYIQQFHIPCVVVLNKIDKLNKYERKTLLEKFEYVLSDFYIEERGITAKEGVLKIISTSTKEKKDKGIATLLRIIQKRASNIDHSKFDPRGELFKKLPIDRQSR